MRAPRRGRFIVIASPSGGGKSTVICRLLERHPDLVYSVSVTTRPPRPGEIHGKSYWFVDREEFQRRREIGELLEWEEVYSDLYGTPAAPAEAAVTAGRNVVFDLDVKGALRLKQKRPDTIAIFLEPPNFEVLESRLRERGTEDGARLQQRLSQARWECDQAPRFEHRVVNADLNATLRSIEQIIQHHLEEEHPEWK